MFMRVSLKGERKFGQRKGEGGGETSRSTFSDNSLDATKVRHFPGKYPFIVMWSG